MTIDMENLIIVRGGGDLATGTIYKLRQCGFSVLVLETGNPSAIRRNVAFSEAVYQGSQRVEGETCQLAADFRAQGKWLFVTTSTHIFIEPDTVLSDDADRIMEELNQTGNVMAEIPPAAGK